MKLFKALFFLFFLPTLLACNSNKTQKKEGVKDTTFVKGKIVTKVECNKDNNQNYALYLPSGYSSDKTYPVIFMFDSHAKGEFAVKQFQEYAEKYGYILIGSNNSKNGIPWETTDIFVNILFDDVFQKFSIDKKRLYTAGFSGGSRVASTIAILKGGVTGVIGIGAGFPNLQQNIQNKFDFIGVVGTADFNYIEMQNLDEALNTNNLRHFLLVHNGKHAWPPQKIVAEIFDWIELNAMKDKLKPADDKFIKERLNYYSMLKDSIKNEISQFETNKQIGSYFDGLTDVSAIKNKSAELEKMQIIINYKKKKAEIKTTEISLQQQYSQFLSTKNLAWWKSDVAKINQIIKIQKNSDESYVYRRLLQYTSLMCYMNASGAFKNNQINAATFYVDIYALVDPENPEHAYMSAWLNAKKGDEVKLFEELKNAVKLGFDDVGRLKTDTIFEPVKDKPEFLETLKSIESANK